MSFVDNIKEQLGGLFSRVSEQVRESETYAQIQDKYLSLTPGGQKAVRLMSVVVVLGLIAFIPYNKFSASSDNILIFEEKRNLIRELFKIYRESSATSNVAVPPDSNSLRFNVDSILQRAELLPEQKIEVAEISPEGRLIPVNVVSAVLSVKLAKLNLKQIVDIGASLTAISDSVKLKDMEIRANVQDTRYYDVHYKLYTLNVPQPTIEPLPEPERPTRRKNNNNDESQNGGGDE
jgi:hypothetical protein